METPISPFFGPNKLSTLNLSHFVAQTQPLKPEEDSRQFKSRRAAIRFWIGAGLFMAEYPPMSSNVCFSTTLLFFFFSQWRDFTSQGEIMWGVPNMGNPKKDSI